MLSGEGNENGGKTRIDLISKNNNFASAAHFLVHFFAVLLQDYNVKLPETSFTRFMEEMSYVFLFNFLFSLLLIFTLVVRLAFLIFSPPLQTFHVVLPTKFAPLFFISRSSSLSLFFSLNFADLSPTFSFSLSSSFLYIQNLWT